MAFECRKFIIFASTDNQNFTAIFQKPTFACNLPVVKTKTSISRCISACYRGFRVPRAVFELQIHMDFTDYLK